MRQESWIAQATEEKIGIGGFRLSKYVPPDEFEKSVMYDEFILENRLERYWCLGMLHATRDGQVATALHKGKKSGISRTRISSPSIGFRRIWDDFI